MKFKILVTTFVALMMSFYGTQVLAGRDGKGNGGKGNTVNVCHVTGNSDVFLISVPSNAENAHLGHGDYSPYLASCANSEPPTADEISDPIECEYYGYYWWRNNQCNENTEPNGPPPPPPV